MHVQLLGRFGVEVGGRRVDAAEWRLRKARTVVKLLALEPAQRLHREYVGPKSAALSSSANWLSSFQFLA